MEWKEPRKKERSKKRARENTGRKEKGLINCHSGAEKCAGAPNLLFLSASIPFSHARLPCCTLVLALSHFRTERTNSRFSLQQWLNMDRYMHTYVLDNKYGNTRNCSIDQDINASNSQISRSGRASEI